MADENVEQVETEQVEPGNLAPETPENNGPGSGRSQLRTMLEKNFEADRRNTERAERQPQRKRKPAVSEAAETYREGAEPSPQEKEQEGEVQTQPQDGATRPPEAWTKEAKAEWSSVPPNVQDAITKREADVVKGVDELKRRYSDIDAALQPRMDVIRKHGHTPGQAVNQLFAWFEALSSDVQRVQSGRPAIALLALAQSFGLDPQRVFGAPQSQAQQAQAAVQAQQQPQQQAQENKQVQPEAGLPDAVNARLSQLEQQIKEQLSGLTQGFTQKIGSLENVFAQQSQAKTEEILANWARDKPHYEDVRHLMGRLIASNAVQPLPNGSADLDRAYEMALYALPEVRNKVLAEQAANAEAARKAKEEAERKAQQAAADKARRANVGLGPSSPGNMPAQTNKKRGRSVKDSIMDAIEEVRN